jgi:hypothetical protein
VGVPALPAAVCCFGLAGRSVWLVRGRRLRLPSRPALSRRGCGLLMACTRGGHRDQASLTKDLLRSTQVPVTEAIASAVEAVALFHRLADMDRTISTPTAATQPDPAAQRGGQTSRSSAATRGHALRLRRQWRPPVGCQTRAPATPEETTLGVGEWAGVPVGRPRRWWNDRQEDAHVLLQVAPCAQRCFSRRSSV